MLHTPKRPGHQGRLQQTLGFSHDGSKLLSADTNGRVLLWSLASGTPIAKTDIPGACASAVAISPDEKTIVAAVGLSRGIHICEVAAGYEKIRMWRATAPAWRWQEIRSARRHPVAHDLEFSPDGASLVALSSEGLVIHHLRPKRPAITIKRTLGNRVALTVHKHTVELVFPDHREAYRLDSGKQAKPNTSLRMADGGAGSKSSHRIHGKTLQVGFAYTGYVFANWRGENDGLLWDKYHRPTQTLAIIDNDTRLVVVNLATGRSQTLSAHPDAVSSVAFLPVKNAILIGRRDRKVVVLELATRRILRTHSLQGPVAAVAASRSGRRYAAATTDAVVVWDSATGKELARYRSSLPGSIRTLAMCADGETIVYGGVELGIVRCGVAERSCPTQWTLGKGSYKRLVFNRDGTRLATLGLHGGFELWRLTDGKQEPTGDSPSRSTYPRTLAMLPSFRSAIVGDAMSTDVRTMDNVAEQGRQRNLGWVTGQVEAVAVRPDGRMVAAAGLRDGVVLWRLPSRKKIGQLRHRSKSLHTIEFSPDGNYLAVVDIHGVLELWRVPQ